MLSTIERGSAEDTVTLSQTYQGTLLHTRRLTELI